MQQAGDIDTAVVLLHGANGATCSITDSRRCSFVYDRRIEAFGSKGMLSVGNQLPTSVRRSDANATEVEYGTTPSPGVADGRAALLLADAANDSLRSGVVVTVEPVTS